MIGVKVKEFYEKNKEILKLSLLGEDMNLDIDLNKFIMNSDVNRPGLALVGYLEYFAFDRIQVLGNVEIFFLRKLSPEKIREVIFGLLTHFNIPCLVVTNGLVPPIELLEECKKFAVPVFKTELNTADFKREVNAYLEEEIAPRISIHGVLMEIYGLGVIIVGNSGIGKSECALDLLKRGHQLICDDLVNIKKKSGGVLIGFANNLLKYHMEIRGMGIINVKQLLGVSSILDRTNIDLVVELEEWDADKQYDRLGINTLYENILEVNIPKLLIPVKPGRNLAGLIEIAAMKHRLKNQGYDTIKELNDTLITHMQNKQSDQNL
jgi:HPr kinase/phosphorylase